MTSDASARPCASSAVQQEPEGGLMNKVLGSCVTVTNARASGSGLGISVTLGSCWSQRPSGWGAAFSSPCSKPHAQTIAPTLANPSATAGQSAPMANAPTPATNPPTPQSAITW